VGFSLIHIIRQETGFILEWTQTKELYPQGEQISIYGRVVIWHFLQLSQKQGTFSQSILWLHI